MKFIKFIVLLFLIGCVSQPKVVEAPTDIYVEGSSKAKPIYQIKLPPTKEVNWSIFISDWTTHKSWSFSTQDVIEFGTTTLVSEKEFDCTFFKYKPDNPYVIGNVFCQANSDDRLISMGTREVSCAQFTKDTYEIHQNDIIIKLTCDGYQYK